MAGTDSATRRTHERAAGIIERKISLKPEDSFILSVYNSKHCKESFISLKNEFSLREFITLKENIQIQELLEAADALDDYKEQKRVMSNAK